MPTHEIAVVIIQPGHHPTERERAIDQVRAQRGVGVQLVLVVNDGPAPDPGPF